MIDFWAYENIYILPVHVDKNEDHNSYNVIRLQI